MVRCPICNEEFRRITNTHLSKGHKITGFEFSRKFPNSDRGMIPWNKGQTKDTHPSLAKLARTMAVRRNFDSWNEKRRKSIDYNIKRSGDLAELIGIILGDGNLTNLPRTEQLRVVCNFRTARLYKTCSCINGKDF